MDMMNTGPSKAKSPAEAPIMRAEDVKVHFPVISGFIKKTVRHIRAVDGISLSIRAGETLSVVGESGCGKTTFGQALVRVLEPTAGQIIFKRDGTETDIAHLSPVKLRSFRADIRMIFQDPFTSLNPRRRVVDIVAEPLRNFGMTDKAELEATVADLLTRVGLRPEYMSRYPYAFSGGERQRIGIARALSVRPKLVVADECISALDVSIQAQTLNLLQDLQEEFDLTYVFISHDLSVVEYISDRIAVMYAGRVVELAATDQVFSRPRHPYTAALLAAVPRPDPKAARGEKRIRLKGEVADPANRPSGCAFHPRCPFATEECRSLDPILRVVDSTEVACHHAEKIDLKGVRENAV